MDGREYPGNTAILRAARYAEPHGTAADRRRGQDAHLATRYYDEGRLDWHSVREAIAPYVVGWAAFRRVSGFMPHWIERPLWSRRWGFATRPDRVGRFGREWALIQIKTGSAEASVGPQTAAEAAAVEEVLGRRVERYVVVLPGNGWFDLERMTSRADWPAFLAALATWHERRRQGWDGRTAP